MSEAPVNSLSLRSGFECKDSKCSQNTCTESQNSGNSGNVQHFKMTFPETPGKADQVSSRICDIFLFAHRYVFCGSQYPSLTVFF